MKTFIFPLILIFLIAVTGFIASYQIGYLDGQIARLNQEIKELGEVNHLK